MGRWLPFAAFAAVVLGALNFISFFVVSNQPGGDSPIPRQPFSLFITHPLAMLGMWYFVLRIFRSMTYRVPETQLREEVGQLEQSGMPLGTVRSGGNIGSIGYSGPLLQVTVYPGGLVIKPIFQPAFAVPKETIEDILVKQSWAGRTLVTIKHRSQSVSNSVTFGLSPQENGALLTEINSWGPASSAARPLPRHTDTRR